MFSWDFPINTEGIIKDRDTSTSLWMVEVITLVLEDFRENSETMSKALWNEELTMIIFCQFYSHMLAVSRGAFTNSTATSSTLPFTQCTSLLGV